VKDETFDDEDGVRPLTILSEDEDGIDEALEAKSQAQSIKLTATNVRSILRVSHTLTYLKN
jgi:hypothetical protein